MQEKPTLTLSMIVKNEEKYLRGCLESVKNLVNEIVIVDTGSTDSTLEIAKEFGARVFYFEWTSDFSAARNFALSKSEGDWILYLDADERLASESVKRLKRHLLTEQNSKTGLRCLVNNIDDFSGSPKLMKYTRLFRNSPSIGFRGKVHEQIDESLLENGYKLTDSDIEIIHLGYNLDKEGLKDKARRNLALLLKEYETNPGGYYAFQLGNTCDILQERQEAINYFQSALKDKSLNRSYRSICHLHIAAYYESVRYDLSSALDEVLAGLKDDPENPGLKFLASRIYQQLGDKVKAISFCKEALLGNKKTGHKNLSSSVLAIYINPEKIIAHGLGLAVQFKDKAAFDFFSRESSGELKRIFAVLYGNMQLSETDKRKIRDIINVDNLDLILILLEAHKDSNAACEILTPLMNRYSENSRFLKTLGNVFLNSGNISEGIRLLEDSLKLKEKDPAALFYLVSALVGNNNIEKLPELLAFGQKEFGHIPAFAEKMNILIKKLEALL